MLAQAVGCVWMAALSESSRAAETSDLERSLSGSVMIVRRGFATAQDRDSTEQAARHDRYFTRLIHPMRRRYCGPWRRWAASPAATATCRTTDSKAPCASRLRCQ